MTKSLQPKLELSAQIATSRIDISGVHALPFADVAALFQPLSGKQVTLEQLALAVQQATQLYQKAGYPLSFVYLPEQSFDQGIVRVIAVEGHASHVQVVGDMGKSGQLLAEIAQPIVESKPLQTEVFTRQTLLMARMLNLKVGAQISPPSTTNGATPLVLNVKREPVVFNVTGEFRQDDPKAVANLTLNDPLWGGSQWQFAALLDDPEDERFVSATLHQWLNAQGTTMRLGVSDFRGQDNFAGDLLKFTTTQRKLELNVMHPLSLSATGSTTIGASFFGLNYAKQYDFPDLGLAFEDQEKVRALQAHWIWQRSSRQSEQSANVTLTQGLNALGAGAKQSPGLPANPAKFDFTRINADYDFRWRFENKLGAAFGMGGQYTADILPTSERVSFGGARFGRGYLPGEAAGDQGWGVSLELNRMFALSDSKWLKTLEPYVLYEEARTSFHSAAYTGQRLQSGTLGLRWSDQRYYALDLSVSKPFGDKSSYNPEQKLRYSLSLTYQLDL
ncbi:MAG TPA: POTRA domain-containing protein [Comamonas sp.]